VFFSVKVGSWQLRKFRVSQITTRQSGRARKAEGFSKGRIGGRLTGTKPLRASPGQFESLPSSSDFTVFIL
jgi:hypothetical protein